MPIPDEAGSNDQYQECKIRADKLVKGLNLHDARPCWMPVFRSVRLDINVLFPDPVVPKIAMTTSELLHTLSARCKREKRAPDRQHVRRFLTVIEYQVRARVPLSRAGLNDGRLEISHNTYYHGIMDGSIPRYPRRTSESRCSQARGCRACQARLQGYRKRVLKWMKVRHKATS
jgi:hypothetical protein